MAIVSFGTKFNLTLTPKQFIFNDSSDWAGQGITTSNVNGNFKITSPSGIVIYNNTDYTNSGCDIRIGVSLVSKLVVGLPLATNGFPEIGTYTIVYTVYNSNTTSYYTITNTYTNNYVQPEVAITQTVDCLSPLFSSIDATNYTVSGIDPTITRTNTIDYPYGSAGEGSPTVGATVTVTSSLFWNGTQTTEIASGLTYTFSDGLIVIDAISGVKEILVDCTDTCGIFCCARTLKDRMITYSTTNTVLYAQTSLLFNQVMSLIGFISMAIRCGKSVEISGVLTVIKSLANCTDDCSCTDGTPTQVIGIGGLTTVTVVESADPAFVIVTPVVVGNVTTYYVAINPTFLTNANKIWTRTFANDAARTAAIPTFDGQLGVQLDTETVYSATGLLAGNWSQVNFFKVGVGANSLMTKNAAAAAGSNSVAIGLASSAAGLSSISIGALASSAGNSSFSVGPGSQSPGVSSVAIGASANSSGAQSLAIGLGAVSSGINTNAIGYGSIAGGDNSVAIGRDAISAGDDSVAMGISSNSTGNDSIAIGNTAVAQEDFSIAIGRDSTAAGDDSIAIGRGSATNDDLAIAVGQSAYASGDSAISIGYGANASVDNTIAIGKDSVSNATESIAIGLTAHASTGGAVAIGSNTSASGSAAIVVGSGATGSGSSGIAIGVSATSSTHGVVAGSGSSGSSTECIAIGYIADSSAQGAISIGQGSVSSGTGSISVGSSTGISSTSSTGAYSVSVGVASLSSAADSIAIGRESVASGIGAISSGGGSIADSVGAIALGLASEAHGQYSLALGNSAIANIDNTLNISATIITRKDSGETPYNQFFSGAIVTIATQEVDLKVVADYTVVLPTGSMFFPDEVDLVLTTINNVTGQPTVRAGGDVSTSSLLAAIGTTALTTQFHRQRFATLLTATGQATLSAGVTIAATGITVKGRFIFRGTLLENE